MVCACGCKQHVTYDLELRHLSKQRRQTQQSSSTNSSSNLAEQISSATGPVDLSHLLVALQQKHGCSTQLMNDFAEFSRAAAELAIREQSAAAVPDKAAFQATKSALRMKATDYIMCEDVKCCVFNATTATACKACKKPLSKKHVVTYHSVAQHLNSLLRNPKALRKLKAVTQTFSFHPDLICDVYDAEVSAVECFFLYGFLLSVSADAN